MISKLFAFIEKELRIQGNNVQKINIGHISFYDLPYTESE